MSVPNTYRFAECRLLGHAWLIVPSDWNPRYGAPMTARCERCNIERRDEINRHTGDVEARRYAYPDGYLFTRDHDADEPPRRVDFRLAWLDDQIAEMKSRIRPTESRTHE